MCYAEPVNVPAAIASPRPVKLTASSFLMLRGFGSFDGYWKAELLDGELWGVPAVDDEEPASDATFPIKLTVTDYELLARAGTFDRHRKTELLDGLVFAMSPQYRPHGFVKDELAYRMRRALEDMASDLRVATEQSVSLAPFSEPQPDIILTVEAVGTGPIPGASVALLVEVADSTSSFDLFRKAAIYAHAGIAEYWVADVNGRTIHRMWTPGPEGYADRDRVAFGNPLAAVTIPALSIGTATL